MRYEVFIDGNRLVKSYKNKVCAYKRFYSLGLDSSVYVELWCCYPDGSRTLVDYLNQIVMCIVVKVYQNDVSKAANKRLFERHIDWSDDLEFPFGHILSSLRVLYPRTIIEFTAL